MRFILWEHSTKWQLLGLCSIYSSEIKIPEPSVPVSCTITTGLTMPSCVPQDHREVVMTQGHSSARFSSEGRYLHRVFMSQRLTITLACPGPTGVPSEQRGAVFNCRILCAAERFL